MASIGRASTQYMNNLNTQEYLDHEQDSTLNESTYDTNDIHYGFDFYPNIWQPYSSNIYVDISQISHVVTSTPTFLESNAHIDAITSRNNISSTKQWNNIWKHEIQSTPRRKGTKLRFMDTLEEEMKDTEEIQPMQRMQIHRRSRTVSIDPAMDEEQVNKPMKREEYEISSISVNASVISVQTTHQSKQMDPPPWPQEYGKKRYSKTFGQPNEWNFSSKFLLSMHEPLRYAMDQMTLYASQCKRYMEESPVESLPSASINTYFIWFKHVRTYFYLQKAIKQEIFMQLCPKDCLPHTTHLRVQELYGGIEVLFQLIHELDVCVDSNLLSWNDQFFRFQEGVRGFQEKVDGILNLEEEVWSNVLFKGFCEHEFEDLIIPKILKVIRPKKIMIPWIIQRAGIWGGDKIAQEWISRLSFSQRLLYKRIWRSYFQSHLMLEMKKMNEELGVKIVSPEVMCCIQ